MLEGPITFDKVARWGIITLGVAMSFLILNYLSAVLLPFFVAWLFAYLMYPLVRFIENRLKIKLRAIAIIIAMVAVLGIFGGVVYLIVPPMIEQFGKFTSLATNYLHNVTQIRNFPNAIQEWVVENGDSIEHFLQSDDFTSTLKETAPKLFDVMGQTMSVIMSVIASCITLLYMFFILMDYENLSTNWIRMFPKSARPFWSSLMDDVEQALNSYIRGQGMVALIMGILFCIGFSVIGFPMAIGLGILIGILDLVPYLHTFALVPTAFLAAMKSAETGQSYWIVFGSALAVFAIVQVIIDMVVTPKVMGKQMGLNPAVLLLSLSIWGALLGFIGLIIALPATTLIIAYWKKYVSER